jgi:hypothetical protein
MNKVSKKYKYLEYVPAPIHLKKSEYDLVDDPEFLERDDRIPLLICTQFGIFPAGSLFEKHPYERLEGLEGQRIGLLGRGYASHRERKGIFELYLDDFIMERIKNEELILDLRLWYDKNGLREDGPYLDLEMMCEPSVYVQNSLAAYIERSKPKP